jgi:hypothetical protein
VTRENTRRVFVLGVAGLVPAALVTLLLLNQPAIGDRRLYPMLRVPLTAIAFTLALATVIAWARSSRRLSRPALSGLAWAAVAVLLCIGPFVESNPRDRLFALELYDDGRVAWAMRGAASHPRLIDGVLVVEEEDSGARVCLDPRRSGNELGREDDRDAADPRCQRALDEDTGASDGEDRRLEVLDGHVVDGHVVDGRVEGTGEDGPWTLVFPGAEVLALVEAGDVAYAYVSTPEASPTRPGDPAHGTIVKIDVDRREVVWSRSLDDSAASDDPALAANADSIVVAGGESITALDGSDGRERWSESVIALGKSRGYGLPGAVHEIVIDDEDGLVLLAVTPAA